MQHIIIGAGPAGVVAAETLRKCDPGAEIAIIGDEPEPPYSRMAIPYYLVDNVDETGTYLRDPKQHFKELNIEVVQQRVDKVDPKAKSITLADGSTREYDKLLIATGSHPVSPPIPGLDLPQVHSCWTLEDARNIARLAQSGSNVVLIGAGFIGCIILEALVKRGVNLTVVETGNRMVPRMLDDKAGGLLETWCKQQGIDVHTSCSVESIEAGDGDQVEVSLSDGGKLSAALVITATGVKANLDLLEGTGIETDFGVLVNRRMQSSDPDIYAAGDVAQGVDFSTGNQQVQAIQPTATDHERVKERVLALLIERHGEEDVTLVTQDAVVFAGTPAENIARAERRVIIGEPPSSWLYSIPEANATQAKSARAITRLTAALRLHRRQPLYAPRQSRHQNRTIAARPDR